MLTKPQRYPNQVDWGDYKTMPDYREGWVDPHASGVVGLGRMLDVTTYIPGLNNLSNSWHDLEQQGTTAGNQILSPVVGFLQDGQDKILPYHKEFHHAVGLDGIDRFIREKPVDAAAIAAATYFSAGALSGAAEGGAAGGGAGLSAGESAAAANAITPAFESGAYGAGAGAASGSAGSAMSAAITPAFESAAGSALAPTAFTYGGIGATGYAAGANALTPSVAQGSSLLAGAKNAYGKFNSVDSYRSNIQRFANNQGPTERERSNAQAAAIGDRILSAGNHAPDTTRSKIASQIMMNKWGMR